MIHPQCPCASMDKQELSTDVQETCPLYQCPAASCWIIPRHTIRIDMLCKAETHEVGPLTGCVSAMRLSCRSSSGPSACISLRGGPAEEQLPGVAPALPPLLAAAPASLLAAAGSVLCSAAALASVVAAGCLLCLLASSLPK